MFGICVEIGSVAVILGFFGLLLDLTGALLVGVVDISRFERFLQTKEGYEQASALQKARRKLFQEGSIEQDEPGFGLLKNVILEQSGSDIDPIKISAPDPGRLGGGGNVFIAEGDGTDKPHDGVGSHNLVDGWIEREIDRLRSGVRNRYRRLGIGLLFIGFTWQLIGYSLRNFESVREIVVGMTPC